MSSSLLFDNFNRYATISETEFEKIEKAMVKKTIKKRRTVVAEGDISRYIYFIETGALRSFTTDPSGNEHVIQLALEDHWIADLYSFITQMPGNVNIEAIEDTTVMILAHHELDRLYTEIPALERYFRQLFQRAYVAAQHRFNVSVSQTAEERYLQLLKDFPQIAARIPLTYIASFLGITPESLSRIRKQIFQ